MENKKNISKKKFTLIAAAALSAVLFGSQIYSVSAENSWKWNYTEEKDTQRESWLPENVTIEESVELSEILLPDTEYGKLKWVDEYFIPTERVQTCSVKLVPYEGTIPSKLKEMEGWDDKEKVLYTSIKVIVSSIEGGSDIYYEETVSEEAYVSEETWIEETKEEDVTENVEESTENITEVLPEVTESPVESEIILEPETTQMPTPEAVEETEEPEPTPEATEESEEPETTPEAVEEVEEPETTPEVVEEVEGPETTPEATEEAEATPEATEESEEISEEENIFDGINEEEVERPEEADENLSPEEMELRARENHSCEGIYVSGINLPWYVQFRVSGGEEYKFTNEEGASIFKSYEFELWNLKDGTEYEIPDGEYISVTIPVKEGYDYSVEHLLDNGATETIIPSVEGQILVFSTHSFSPFGIAGSKPIVGGDIAEESYPEPTEDSEVTVTPQVTGTPQQPAENTEENASEEQTQITVTPEVMEETVEESAKAPQEAAAVQGVNTGDDTAILPMVILVLAATGIILFVILLKKKRK